MWQLIPLILATTPLVAALPPLAQSVREIQALVSDSQMQTLLGSAEAIREIIRTESGYTVMTTHYTMKVDVEYKPAPRPGPIPFQLQFHKPVALEIAKTVPSS